jgi:hypothetical protein
MQHPHDFLRRLHFLMRRRSRSRVSFGMRLPRTALHLAHLALSCTLAGCGAADDSPAGETQEDLGSARLIGKFTSEGGNATEYAWLDFASNGTFSGRYDAAASNGHQPAPDPGHPRGNWSVSSTSSGARKLRLVDDYGLDTTYSFTLSGHVLTLRAGAHDPGSRFVRP